MKTPKSKKTENIRDFYEKEAVSMTRYSSNNFWEKRYHTLRMELLIKLLKNEKSLPNFRKILDIGCGTGEYLTLFEGFSNEIYGLDISRQYLERCGAKQGKLVLADLRYLPFINQAFDCIFCSEVIEHIKPNEDAINEIFRVSQKCILISTPNHGVLRMVLSILNKNKLLSIDSLVGHINIVGFNHLKMKFSRLGWKKSRAFTVNIFPPFLDNMHLPALLAPMISCIEVLMNYSLTELGTVTIIYVEKVKG